MQMKKLEEVYTNRELSWLQFNGHIYSVRMNEHITPVEQLEW